MARQCRPCFSVGPLQRTARLGWPVPLAKRSLVDVDEAPHPPFCVTVCMTGLGAGGGFLEEPALLGPGGQPADRSGRSPPPQATLARVCTTVQVDRTEACAGFGGWCEWCRAQAGPHLGTTPPR